MPKDLAQLPKPAVPVDISQATAVEQARAIAEVRAAVMVAQECPRDLARAFADMRDTCRTQHLADRAFYRVPNRGQGPSVHLARELARVWGNIDYGVRELRRDDAAGVSEVLAFAWDVQTNSRSSRTFVVPHQRMVKGARVNLTDLGDVYLNNQNVGARAVRECIWSVLPVSFVEEAEATCRETLRGGGGKPLAQRVDDMVAAFARLHVTVEAIEAKLGRKRDVWDADDVATMTVVWQSVQRGDITVGDEFGGAAPVSAASFAPTLDGAES